MGGGETISAYSLATKRLANRLPSNFAADLLKFFLKIILSLILCNYSECERHCYSRQRVFMYFFYVKFVLTPLRLGFTLMLVRVKNIFGGGLSLLLGLMSGRECVCGGRELFEIRVLFRRIV